MAKLSELTNAQLLTQYHKYAQLAKETADEAKAASFKKIAARVKDEIKKRKAAQDEPSEAASAEREEPNIDQENSAEKVDQSSDKPKSKTGLKGAKKSKTKGASKIKSSGQGKGAGKTKKTRDAAAPSKSKTSPEPQSKKAPWLVGVLAAGLIGGGAAAYFYTQGAFSSAPATAESSVEELLVKVSQGDAPAIWQAMPPKYQSDINQVVQLYGDKFDPEVYDKSMATFNKVVDVFIAKRDMILAHPQVATSLSKNGTDLEQLQQGWNSIFETLKSVSTGPLASVDNIKQFDGAAFLGKTGNALLELTTTMAELKGEANPLLELAEPKIEVLSSQENLAELNLTISGNSHRIELVKQEQYWLPKDMVKDWDANIAKARQEAENMEQKAVENKAQIMMVLGMVDNATEQFMKAETQEAFNQSVQSLMGMAMGMMMGGMMTAP